MEQETEEEARYERYRQMFREFLEFFEQRSFRDGELKGIRWALLGLLELAGIPLAEEDRARIQTCTDVETLHRWAENVLGAKTAADVLS